MAEEVSRELDRLAGETERLEAEKARLETENERLKQTLEWFKRQVFGEKSERFTDLPDKNQLLLGLNLPASESEAEPPAKETTAEAPKRKRGRRTGQHEIVIPDDLPFEEIVHELPEEKRIDPKTGRLMVEFDREVVVKLAYKPSAAYIVRHVYVKYAVPGESLSGVIQAPAPPCVLPGSKLDVSFMAYVVSEKFGFHMPLNRVQERLNLQGVEISRQTLCALVIALGQKILPLYELMRERALAQRVLFVDDTPVNLMVKGAGKTKQARMWIYLGGLPNAPPYHVYEFTEDRCQNHMFDVLENFSGAVHADAYSGNVNLDADRDDFLWAACWAHGRRKFEPDQKAGDDFAAGILADMRELFMLEREAWERSSEERLLIRAREERPLVDALFEKFRKRIYQGDLTPSSRLAEAIGYMQKHEANFRAYLDDPNLRMDNNPAERALRKVVLGRKNWLYLGSARSGKSAAALISLVQTCRAMKIDPQAYLEDVFTRLLDHPAKRLEEFLPDQWARLREEKAVN